MSDEARIPDAVSHPAVPCHGLPSGCNSERRRIVKVVVIIGMGSALW